jgi:hypothetical protein
VVTLQPSQYSAQVRGKPETTGVGIVQVYFLQLDSKCAFGELKRLCSLILAARRLGHDRSCAIDSSFAHRELGFDGGKREPDRILFSKCF